MKEYMLIFRHQDGGKIASPEQMQIWMQQTMDWLNGLKATGNFEGKGDGLIFDDALVVHHDKTVTNGPFGEIKETLGGYVVVKANSAQEAAECAKGCPVLQGEGNTVEVRRLAKGDGVHS
ncbi:YciI family protein [Mucilaginibacter calamicampi]|uniref:YciI family protein n=1 Tax=Mucilaginibacter calamicampi TaxID=1302352 RepID=A0ABW2Z3P4_9SPHI